GKLSWPRVLRRSLLVRQRDGLRQKRVRWTFERDHRCQRRPIGQIWGASIEKLVEGPIRRVSRQIVIVARVMIASSSAVVAQRSDNGQVVRLPGQIGQMFAEHNARGAGPHRPKWTAIFRG